MLTKNGVRKVRGLELKVAFFQKVQFVFLDLQISKKKNIPKNYLELKIQNSRPYHNTVFGGNSKFQVQDSFLEYFFFKIWRSKKRISLSEKKPPLVISKNLQILSLQLRIS